MVETLNKLDFEGEFLLLNKTRIMKFIASVLMSALFSHANSLELATNLNTDKVIPIFGDGPILMQPNAWDPLSYHGT